MISIPRNCFEARLREYGYTLDEVKGCIIRENDKVITIDQNHASYPRAKKHEIVSSSGPGTELKKLLKKIGITASPTCSCNTKAKIMDKNGIEWCENNLDTIVGWLKEEAIKRNLPFIDMAGRILVNRAIKNAKRNKA